MDNDHFHFLSIPWGTEQSAVEKSTGFDFSSAYMEELTDKELYYPDVNHITVCGAQPKYLELEFYKDGLSSVSVYFELEDAASAREKFDTLLQEATEIYGAEFTETKNTQEWEIPLVYRWEKADGGEQTAFSLSLQETENRHGVFLFLQNALWYEE